MKKIKLLSALVFLLIGNTILSQTIIPSAVSELTNGNTTKLDGARNTTTVKIGDNTYALVAAFGDDSVQIIDITNPTSPNPIATVTDEENGFTKLNGSAGITTAEIKGKTYALVTAYYDDAVEIINITDPANPIATATITNGKNGFTKLNSPTSVTTVVIEGSTYALVTAKVDNSVVIINITNPALPTPAATLTDGVDGFAKLKGAYHITAVKIGTSVKLIIN